MRGTEAAHQAEQAKLDLMLRGGRPEAVAQAQAALEAASAKLAQVEHGATNDVRQAAMSAVDSDVPRVAGHKATAEDLKSLRDTLAAWLKEWGAGNTG